MLNSTPSFWLALCVGLFAAPIWAQAPPGYYAAVDTTNASTLRTTLHDVIDDHQIFPYTSGSSDTWDILKKADEDPTNASRILDVYRNADYPKVAGGSGSYNREHSWPNSLGFPNDDGKNYPYTDCHQLFLSDIAYNGARGSLPFGDTTGTEWPTLANHGVGGGTGVYPGNSNWAGTTFFEVWSDRRGDLARALLYLDVRYDGSSHGATGWSEPDLILTDNLSLINASSTGNNESVAYMGRLSTLLAWHAADPVDAKELARNDAVFSYQGNRNPFIDHPEWVDCVFAGGCSGDTIAPGAPQGLAATVNGATINLDWNDNSEGDFAGYRVNRALAFFGPYSEISAGLVTNSQYTDPGLTAGTTYYYQVTAEDTSGNLSFGSLVVSATAQAGSVGAGTPWINELHYDNAGADTGEFVELAGPAGLDLTGYTLTGVNGAGGALYGSVVLSGSLPDQGQCLGTLVVPIAGLQNGAPDGVALIDPNGVWIEFLSYEGAFAVAGQGFSTDIGVFETNVTPVGFSLQLGGLGKQASDFTWQAEHAATPGALNANQVFTSACTVACGLTEYGHGASPANVMTLSGTGPPALGTQFNVSVTPAFTPGSFLAISAQQADLALFGGQVLINPFNQLFPLSFAPLLANSSTWTLSVPNNPNFIGLKVYAQAFGIDNNQAGGYAMSNGLAITVCP